MRIYSYRASASAAADTSTVNNNCSSQNKSSGSASAISSSHPTHTMSSTYQHPNHRNFNNNNGANVGKTDTVTDSPTIPTSIPSTTTLNRRSPLNNAAGTRDAPSGAPFGHGLGVGLATSPPGVHSNTNNNNNNFILRSISGSSAASPGPTSVGAPGPGNGGLACLGAVSVNQSQGQRGQSLSPLPIYPNTSPAATSPNGNPTTHTMTNASNRSQDQNRAATGHHQKYSSGDSLSAPSLGSGGGQSRNGSPVNPPPAPVQATVPLPSFESEESQSQGGGVGGATGGRQEEGNTTFDADVRRLQDLKHFEDAQQLEQGVQAIHLSPPGISVQSPGHGGGQGHVVHAPSPTPTSVTTPYAKIQQQPLVRGLQSATIDLSGFAIQGGGMGGRAVSGSGSAGMGTGGAEFGQGHQSSFAFDQQRLQPQNQLQQAGGYGSLSSLPSLTKSSSLESVDSTTPSATGFPSSVSEVLLGGVDGGKGGYGNGFGNGDSGRRGSYPDLGPRTPNVYINGLPPHFPEDELFNLASEFGPIRSVRTFTRHVRDSESGYGFVLFENVDDAEKCILSLRKYRNLHPTFSKQMHKIPGTAYAQITPSSSSSSWDGNPPTGGENSSAEASFKAKMESLHDPTSTNLYMEGLPLSIDEPTLSALVSPHRISSSRFFQTRLSNPPRIIAFVRLETRAGAEEVIERLHGRMVRGWNDSGSRISVRFADTSEQRELRRSEHAVQEGDNSPARLTIAQAALLNLRGQDLKGSSRSTALHAHHTQSRIPSSSSVSSMSRGGSVGGVGGGFNPSISAPDFTSSAPGHHSPYHAPSPGHLSPYHAQQHNLSLPVIGSGSGGGNGLEVDYSLAPGHVDVRSRSPYHGHDQAAGLPSNYDVYPQIGQGAIDASLSTSSFGSYRNGGVGSMGGSASGYGLNGMGYGSRGIGGYQQTLPMSQSMDSLQSYVRPSPAYTRSGYTATEEYIMRAHAENALLAQTQQQQQQPLDTRRRPAPLDLRRTKDEEDLVSGGMDGFDAVGGGNVGGGANIGVGMRGYRAQASLMSPVGSMGSMGSIGSVGDLTMRSATIGGGRGDEDGGGVGSLGRYRQTPNSAPPQHVSQLQRSVPISESPLMQSSASQGDGVAQMHDSPNAINDAIFAYQQQQPMSASAHMRSTTLPQHWSSSIREREREREAQIQAAQQAASGSPGSVASSNGGTSVPAPAVGGGGRGHFSHNSLSLPAQNARTPQHANVSKLGGPGVVEGSSDGSLSEGQEEKRTESVTPTGTAATYVAVASGAAPAGASAGGALKSHYSSSAIFGDLDGGNNVAGASPMSASSSMSSMSVSSSLISPTLTYASQTPSTLSPATPFFGSFNSINGAQGSENFEKGANGQQQKTSQGQAGQKNMKAPLALERPVLVSRVV